MSRTLALSAILMTLLGSSAANAQTPNTGVTMPLAQYEALLQDIRRLRQLSGTADTAVRFGAAEYRSEATAMGLRTTVQLSVHLGNSRAWKVVPLLDAKAGMMSARANGVEIPVSADGSMHQWVTNRQGVVAIELEALIPSAGPHGAIEYDFAVPETPLTTFSCDFPIPRLEPKVDGAVRTSSTTAGGRTRYQATLKAVSRIHLVGFRDLEDNSKRQAKILAEALHLLSVGDEAAELFSVIRYNILYAGTKQFTIRIPPHLEVLQADGEGAFTYTLGPIQADGSRLLLGETAFPIRNHYEISLRLRRPLSSGDNAEELLFEQPGPVAEQVERVYGWLGVEITGKLNIQRGEAGSTGAAPIDLRQLPPDMLQNAVSPILHAFRLQGANARVALRIQPLPELELASDSVDTIRATSVLTDHGKLLTEIRITMRNRLRPQLRLTLPQSTRVRSSFLDGSPVKPSRDKSGHLLLPLKSSTGGGRARPFTLQIALETTEGNGGLSLFGLPQFVLPAVDLPVSSLTWKLHLPARNAYGQPIGDVSPQVYAGAGQYYEAPVNLNQRDFDNTVVAGDSEIGAESSGDMPVRFKLPRQGTVVETKRFWLAASTPIEISVPYVRGWLRIPLLLLLLIAAALGTALAGGSVGGRRRRMGAALVAGAGMGAVSMGAGSGTLLLCLVVLGGTLWLRFNLGERLSAALSEWRSNADGTVGELSQAWKKEGPWVLWRLLLLGVAIILTATLLSRAMEIIDLFGSPLP